MKGTPLLGKFTPQPSFVSPPLCSCTAFVDCTNRPLRSTDRLLLHRDFASCFWPTHPPCIYSHSTHCQALCATVNILTVSNWEKYADPKVNYVTYNSFSEWNVTSKKGAFLASFLWYLSPCFLLKRFVFFLFPFPFILSWTTLLCYCLCKLNIFRVFKILSFSEYCLFLPVAFFT